MIRKGDIVKIKPEWQDAGDDLYTWVAMNDEEKGRVDISPVDIGLPIPPINTVLVEWIEK